MYRKEVNERSPLRILERSIHGGLGAGHLGVVMARAGVGKTTFLVQIGLDDAMRERSVLHIALDQSLEHVRAWYDVLFDDLAEAHNLEQRETARAVVNQNRVIQTFLDPNLTEVQLEQVLTRYQEGLGFRPAVLIIDGLDWQASTAAVAERIATFKTIAKRLNAELWMSAQTHRDVISREPAALMPPCQGCQAEIDVAVFLEPEGSHVAVRLLKDHDHETPPETNLLLESDTMRLLDESALSTVEVVPPSGYTLLSGGAKGAEAEFGAHAERFGIREITFSFAGRTPTRQRGLRVLSNAELRQGEVSNAYVESHLQRTFPEGEEYQSLLQTIWHQVATAGEVFVVGVIQENGTMRGGTGWAAELARHFKKRLHLFDQEQEAWLAWHKDSWQRVEPPKIQRRRFSGSGTRNLSEAGKAAIARLFADSFTAT